MFINDRKNLGHKHHQEQQMMAAAQQRDGEVAAVIISPAGRLGQTGGQHALGGELGPQVGTHQKLPSIQSRQNVTFEEGALYPRDQQRLRFPQASMLKTVEVPPRGMDTSPPRVQLDSLIRGELRQRKPERRDLPAITSDNDRSNDRSSRAELTSKDLGHLDGPFFSSEA